MWGFLYSEASVATRLSPGGVDQNAKMYTLLKCDEATQLRNRMTTLSVLYCTLLHNTQEHSIRNAEKTETERLWLFTGQAARLEAEY